MEFQKWFEASFGTEVPAKNAVNLVAKLRAGDEKSRGKGEKKPERPTGDLVHTMVPLSLFDDEDFKDRKGISFKRVKDYEKKKIEDPIFVRKSIDGKVRVSDGKHRLRAAKNRGDRWINALASPKIHRKIHGGKIDSLRGFKEWLLFVESATVAQWLKSQQHLPIKEVKQTVEYALNSEPFFKQLTKPNIKQLFINFFTYQYILSMLEVPSAAMKLPDTDPEKWKKVINPMSAGGYVKRLWGEWGDFLVANWQQVRNKLNSASYTDDQVKDDVEQWHMDLAARERGMPSEDFKVALALDNLPGWKGWKWVSLERGYCSDEAEAMGHCGNQGAREGDNILSLRDPEGYAHLTFIVNSKLLGEAKGRGNTKPSKKYHPAIMALLKSPWVDSIKGGGYKPENNFSFEDLNQKQQQVVSKTKPYMNDWLEYAIEKDVSSLYDILGLTAQDKPHIEGDDIVLTSYDDISDLEEVFSKDSNLDAWFGEDSWQHYETGYSPNWNDIEYYMDEEIEKMILQYGKEEEIEGEDAEEIYDNSDEIRDALARAYWNGSETGTQNEAWKWLVGSARNGEHGFRIYMDKHPWQLKITKSNLKDILKTDQDDIEYYGGIQAWMVENEVFTFKPPYNGFSDFDEETFKERAKEELQDLGVGAAA